MTDEQRTGRFDGTQPCDALNERLDRAELGFDSLEAAIREDGRATRRHMDVVMYALRSQPASDVHRIVAEVISYDRRRTDWTL